MGNKVRIVQHGIGPIGCNVANLVVNRSDLFLVGVVDIDPHKVGKDVSELIGLRAPLGIHVTEDLENLLATEKVDLVTNCTTSSISILESDLRKILKFGVDVISTCEELAWTIPQTILHARAIDRLARENGATVLGTGINPGFMMDTFPIFLTAICQDVTRIEVLRVVNALERREQLQRKVGVGITIEEFERLVSSAKVGHIGMLQSVSAIAQAFSLELDEMSETIEPAITDMEIRTGSLFVRSGQVAGVIQKARGYKNSEEVIYLELQIYVGANESFDQVRIDGTPSIESRVRGIQGDICTAAIVINCIPLLQCAEAGLITMTDLPLPHFGNWD